MKKQLIIVFLSFFSLALLASNPISLFKSNNDVKRTQESFLGAEISGKAGINISKYMQRQEKYFSTVRNVSVTRVRGGEVLEITVPAESLFLNNDSVFSEMADLNLRPILTFFRKNTTDLIIAVHTDNTGSKAYLESLSNGRAKAIENWFITNKVPKDKMEIFSYADSVPLSENDSMTKRQKNRRVTFYLIPNKEMIKQAKRGKL